MEEQRRGFRKVNTPRLSLLTTPGSGLCSRWPGLRLLRRAIWVNGSREAPSRDALSPRVLGPENTRGFEASESSGSSPLPRMPRLLLGRPLSTGHIGMLGQLLEV